MFASMAHVRRVRLPALALCLSACGGWEGGNDPGRSAAASTSSGAGGAAGASACPEALDPERAEARSAKRGFKVVGNEIVDAKAEQVILRGVNRSGSEYQCSKGFGIFDGAADEEAVRAMSRWNINAVRVPLNEACWLRTGRVLSVYSGENYKTAIVSYVHLLQKYGLVPILDLHWAAPGDRLPDGLLPMPNADHSEAFWVDVAETFKDNDGVIFEPYNEPFPLSNADNEAAWQCWRDGCDALIAWGGTNTYDAVGMQALVDAIRSTGSEHLILLGGVQFSNALTHWLEYKPEDPLDNLAAAWHIYNFNSCDTEECWNQAPLEVAAEYPIVATELGQRDCEGDFISGLVDWLDQQASGYLAWSWNAFGACVPEDEGRAWSLVDSYYCPTPNGTYANTFYELLESHGR